MSHPTTTLALLDALHEKWHQRFMALSAKDSEKRVGRATSEAANDLGDIIESYESERLASEETDEPMRTLPEAISSRIVIPHASFSLEMTSDGISPDLYATLTGTATPAADITEEPPVGSRLTDCQWHVWRRGERGWGIEGLIPGSDFDNPWSTVQLYAPLTALEPAPADDITETSPAEDVPAPSDAGENAGGGEAAVPCPASPCPSCAPLRGQIESLEADLARMTRGRDEARRERDDAETECYAETQALPSA